MNKNIYRVGISGIMLSVLGNIVYCFYSGWYSNYFVVHFDSLFSQKARKEIISWIDQAYSSYSLPYIINKLQKQFPCIKSVRYRYRPQGTYDIFVSCHAPRIILNSISIITDQALIAPYNYFIAEYLEGLPRITSEDVCMEIPVYLCRILLSISSFIFQKYCVKLCDQNTILLGNQYQECIILANKDSLNNVSTIEKAYQLFSTRNSKKNSTKNYIYDIRFNNQILEYVMKGELG